MISRSQDSEISLKRNRPPLGFSNILYCIYFVFRGAVFYGKEVDKWSLPFLGSDPSVVRRTQRYKYEELEQPPLQYGAYFTMPSILYIAALMFFGSIFNLLASFQCGRNLLEKVRL